MKKKILIFNGSPQGKKGNCAVAINSLKKKYKNYSFDTVVLSEKNSLKKQLAMMEKADAFLFTTGTYWDSWGHPLQAWLEKMTPYEGTKYFLNKPVAVLVLMHSVGGKGVLSRLQGVLNTLGCVIPPMSGVVYSLVSELALKTKSSHSKDFWSLDDLEMVLANLEAFSSLNLSAQTWPVDRKEATRKWLKV